MNDNVSTINNTYDRLLGLVTRYQSNNGDRYEIIVIFRDLLFDITYSIFGVSDRIWELSCWFGTVIAGDYPNQISFTSNIDTIDNIIEYYEKIYRRDDIINDVLK